ncbi:MAG: hypothetical protein IKD76_00395 [Clostridia bacterium]|nr:hypothetical protein [Clostridia bacterium]
MSGFAQKTKTCIAVEKKLTKDGFINKNTIQNEYTNKIDIKERRGRRIYAQFLCA